MIELPPHLKYYYDKSLESFQHGHFVYAIEMSKAVIKQAPNYSPAYKLLYQSAQNLNKAKSKNLLSSFLSKAKVLYCKFSSYINRISKNTNRVQWNYIQGLSEQPNDRQLLKSWLQLAIKEGWLDIAIIPAEALCEVNPKLADGYLLLSNLYLKKGTADHAKAVIQKGLFNLPAEPQLTRRLKEIEAERTMRRGDWGKT